MLQGDTSHMPAMGFHCWLEQIPVSILITTTCC